MKQGPSALAEGVLAEVRTVLCCIVFKIVCSSVCLGVYVLVFHHLVCLLIVPTCIVLFLLRHCSYLLYVFLAPYN